MSLERLTRNDLKTMGWALLLGALGLGIALRYYTAAFPEASINFKVSRPEVEQRAREFLLKRGFDLTPYRQTILFRYADSAKIYLERELGLEEANRLMASEISVWRWKVRFFKPPEKEELIVWLDPAGQLVGFEHIIEERIPGARLEKSQAQSVAEVFLHNYLNLDLADYRLVEDILQERPHRLDYLFTWERKNFKAKEATYRIAASIQGDQVGKALPLLKVPESWQRDYEGMRSRNQILQSAASLFLVPLIIALLLTLIPAIRQGRIVWKPLLGLGAFVGVVLAVNSINNLSLDSENISAATTYPTFIFMEIVGALILGLLIAMMVTVTAAGGDAVYRGFSAERVALPRLFTLSGLRTKEFFTATVIGYSLAAAQMGFVVIFYLAAERFGAWSPMEPQYNNSLNTTLPWLYPLTIGLQAATLEEFVFRLFAIPFLKKYLKSTWLAVLLPAFIWGFLHSGYPQQPSWIRGVEVGLVGVALGFVFLRFGILSTLVAHYTFNAASVGILLLRSDNFYFILSGGLVMDAVLIPLVIAGALYWQHRQFNPDPQLYNGGLPPPAPVPQPAPEAALPLPSPRQAVIGPTGLGYAPLSLKGLGLAAAAGLVGLALWIFLPVDQVLDSLRWQKGPREAEQIADRYLENRGVHPQQWQRITNYQDYFQGQEAEYVRRHGGIQKVNELWSGKLQTAVAGWRVRYFHPRQKEEHLIHVSPDGRVARYEHLLEERAPGDNLTSLEAQQRTAAYLLRNHQLDVSAWKLVEEKLEKREARSDYHLVWEEPNPVVAEGYVRAEADVRGGEVGGYRTFLRVPEEWTRELTRMRIQNLIAGAIIILIIATLLVLAARLMRGHPFRWRIYVWLTLLVSAVNLLSQFNHLRSLGAGYNTSIPWAGYLFQQMIGSTVLAVMGIAILTFLLALLADLFYAARTFARELIPGGALFHSAYFRDALVAGISVALGFRGFNQLAAYISQLFPLPQRSVSIGLRSVIDTYLPGLSSGINGILEGLLRVALLGIALGFFQKFLHSRMQRLAVLAAIAVILPMAAALGWREFFQNLALLLPGMLLWLLAFKHLLRNNLVSYLVAFSLLSLLSDVIFYWNHPAFRWSVPVVILSASLFLAGLVFFLQGASRFSREGTTDS